MTAKYLVTGACGFIGSHIVEALLDRGEQVLGTDSISISETPNLNFISNHPNGDKFSFKKGDLKNQSFCKDLCLEADYIFHQAALISVEESIKSPNLYANNNVFATLNLMIEATKHSIQKFILASSAAIYGKAEQMPIKESELPRPLSPYAMNKLTGEHFVKLFSK